MKTLHLITVGKLRDKNLISIEQDYLKRITGFKVVIHELKAHEENLDLEAKEVLKKLTDLKALASHTALLAEKGSEFSSSGFSDWLFKLFDREKQVIMIIGGASGHGEEVLSFTKLRLSLSKLTFPHQVARTLLAEQLYRAETIFKRHPYHK